MKKFLVLLILIFVGQAFASEVDYRTIYKNLEVPTFSYVHGIDPGHYYDNQNASYSVYPLFRLCSPIFFKKVRIVPGYYDLTPREQDGKHYILFKQNGMVRYIIPTFKREVVPLGFYESHLPKVKRTLFQKAGDKMYVFIGNHFKRSRRKPTAKTYLEVNDMEDNFVVMIVYYNDFRYYTIFRTIP